MLNIQQQIAAQAPSKPLLIVAGAGTGKTLTLTSRIAYLISQGIDPRRIIALTFTNKAAKEMGDRLKTLITLPDSKMPFLGTFHSFGARLLRSEGRFLGRGPNYVIYDDQDSSSLIKKILKELKVKSKDYGPAFFIRHITAIKNSSLNPKELATSLNHKDQLAFDVYERYEKALRENNAFDFDDLIEKLIRVFQNHPERLKKYRALYTHILVDEYQDLNPTQYELIRLLAGTEANVSVVGDDQQMIYGWRFAHIDTFLNFEKDWPEAQVVLLEENYRSTSNIIRAASAVIAKNEKQKAKELWTKNPSGSFIKILEAGHEENEAEWIAEQIEILLEEKSGSPGMIGILYRTNAQSRPIEQSLLSRNIPYFIFGGLKFYERREIKDIVAGLRYAANPKDSVSVERLQKTFTKSVCQNIIAELDRIRNASPSEIIETFLSAADYFKYLEKNFVNALERKENIAELVRFSKGFSELSALLEQISLVQQTDVPEHEKQKGNAAPVHLMTIHLAKGLEFDHVFLAGTSEGLLPHARSLSGPDEVEEERRLMYVAMTRARKELAISFYDLPSRFLFEVPTELTEFESLVSEATALDDNEERYITLD